MRRLLPLLLLLLVATPAWGQKLLVPMDLRQTNHLKAYGIAFMNLEHGLTVDWLLNYRGGSFMLDYTDESVREMRIRNVTFEALSGSQAAAVYAQVNAEDANMDVVKLEKAPKIAVYTPPDKRPWDDAVTMALTYAEVPYDKIYDEEVLTGKLRDYDWLHLHHEDFTGQYGKFYASYRNASWYQQQQLSAEALARKLGFRKVSEEKKAVARTIKSFVMNGGFLFAMCSATDSYDIALASEGLDIAAEVFDGDPIDPGAQNRLDFTRSLAFQNFSLEMNPLVYEFSDIDVTPQDAVFADGENDYFSLFEFSAKWDPVPTMLTQNHVATVHGFMGQTTAFKKSMVKPSVVILAENVGRDEVKYLHGNLGRGTFTFYGGHDPEDYQHLVNDPPTDLALHPNSPGYRLILNNILFPAAKKKKQKT